MGGIVLVAALIGIVVALASSAHAEETHPAQLPPGPSPIPPPVIRPSAPVPIAPSPIINRSVDALKEGSATPELLSAAIEEARKKGYTNTEEVLTRELDTLMAEHELTLVERPDNPSSPIPLDPATGKTLWYTEVKRGSKMVLPRFEPILQQFKTLQSVLKVTTDGRIGPKTLAAFKKSVTSRGFTRYPDSIETLAANVIKWTEVLRRDLAPTSVGAMPSPFDDVDDGAWQGFLERLNQDWPEFIEHIGNKLGSFVGKEIKLSSGESAKVTLSGVLALARCAGVRGAQNWLSNEKDREKFPNTTKIFDVANGIF